MHIRTLKRLMPLVMLALLTLTVLLPTVSADALPTKDSPPDFAAIDAYVEQQMRDLRIPGLALGIVEGDQIVHLKGFGVAGSDGRPVTPETPFQIGSLGKPMTAVAVMQLVEASKLEFDAPVQRYLPWFRVADEAASAQITIRHLLYHTSGLPTAAGMEHAFSGDARSDALEQRVRALRSVQLNRPIGASYEYSNAGYITLGLLVQEVSGQPYEAYMHEHIFAPLQMRQTFTDWTEARAHGASSGHRSWFGVPQAGELAVNRGNLPTGAHTSGSAEDMTHFLIAQLNGGRFNTTALLSPASIAEMQRPVVPWSGGSQFQAMGWVVAPVGSVTTLVKNGATGDFLAYMILIPERHLGVVVLMNANRMLDLMLGDGRLEGIPYNVLELLLGQQPTVFAADPKPPLFYAILLLAIIVQAAGMARTVMLLRRWRDQPHLHPQGVAALVTRLGLPLLCNLGWSLVALVGVPKLFGMPLSHIIYIAPDFGYTLLVSGVVALGWGIIRTSVMLWMRRAAERGAAVAIGTPINA